MQLTPSIDQYIVIPSTAMLVFRFFFFAQTDLLRYQAVPHNICVDVFIRI
jgi:hypothetical protein